MSTDPYNSLLDEMERKAAPQVTAPKVAAPKAPSRPYGAYEAQTEGEWSISRAPQVKDWYRQTYGRDLPVTAEGMSATHRKMGLDHSDSMDVGVNPTTAEGQAFVKYLKESRIPFLAYDRAVPGAATAAHVHVGFPSHGGAPAPSADPYDALLNELEAGSPPLVPPTTAPTAAPPKVAEPAYDPLEGVDVLPGEEVVGDIRPKAPSIYTAAGRAARDKQIAAETQRGSLYRIPVGQGATREAVESAVTYLAKEVQAPAEFVERWLREKGLGLYDPEGRPLESSPTGYAAIPAEMVGQMRRDYKASLSLPSRAVRNVSEALQYTPGEHLAGVAGELYSHVSADPVTLSDTERAELAREQEAVGERGQYGRALVQPFEQFSAGLGTQAGNVLEVLGREFGVDAVKGVGEYLQKRGAITQQKSQMRPEGETPEYGPEIVRYATGAGLSIAELIALKRVSGLPLPVIMAGESLARDLDKGPEVQAQNAVTAFGSGLLLEKTGALGRLAGGVAQTGLDVGQSVLAGDPTATTVAKGVGGAILGAAMGGRPEGEQAAMREAVKPEGDARVLGDLTRRAVPESTVESLPDIPVGTLERPRVVKGRAEAAPEAETSPQAEQAQTAPTVETIIRHSDPRIDGGRVVGQTSDGRLKVENNEGGVSLVQHPRKQGNREATLVRREVAPEAADAGTSTSGEQRFADVQGPEPGQLPDAPRAGRVETPAAEVGAGAEGVPNRPGVAPSADVPAPPRVATPAEPVAAPEVIDKAFFKQFDTPQGIELDKASDALAAEVSARLAKGDAVTLVADNGRKRVPIVAVSRGMMQDAKGQRWGTIDIASGGSHVEIGKPKAIAESTPAPRVALPERPNVAEPTARTAERSFPQTAEAAGLSKATNTTYEVAADAPAIERAAKRIETEGADKVALAVRTSESPSKDDIVAGQLLARKYSESGNHEAEVAVINDLAEKLTKAGQSVQAASLIARLSPEGVLLQGQRLLNRRGANRTLTAEESAALKETAARAREAEAKVSDLQRQIEEMQLRPRSVGSRPRTKLETFEERLNRLESEARARLDARKAAGAQGLAEMAARIHGDEKGAVALTRGRTPATKTPQFKRWFGGSKVVDERGEPLTVYHGTAGDFKEFKYSEVGSKSDAGWFGRGFYFTPDAEFASRYAEAPGGNVLPVHLNIKNPYDWRAGEGRGLFQNDATASREATRRLERQGYDGVVVYDERIKLGDGERLTDKQWEKLKGASKALATIPKERVEQMLRNGYEVEAFVRAYGEDVARAMPKERTLKEVVAFYPEQIKSATGNSGAFDPKNASIIGASTIPLDIADYAIIGAVKLARKGVTVASWSAEMVREFGEEIRPHLRAIYQTSFEQLKEERAAARRESRERAAQREVPGPHRPEDLQRVMKQREDAQKAAQAARRELERTFRNLSRTTPEKVLDNVTAIRRAGLLTSVKTHLRNFTSNAVFQASEEVTRPLAALGDMAASRLTGQRTTRGLDPAAVASGVKEFATAGLRDAKEIILGREVLPLGGKGATPDASKLQLDAAETGIRLFDDYVNTVFRSLEASDRAFKLYAFKRELIDIARSQALAESRRDSSVNARVRARELQENPTDAMVIEAAAYADYATFQNDNAVSSAVRAGKRKLTEAGTAGRLGKFAIEQIAPFDRTPTNIIYRVFENSPAGFISAASKAMKMREAQRLGDEVMTRAEQKAFARTFGRASTGTILSALGVTLAAKGLLTGTADYASDREDYMKKRREAGGGGMLKVGGQWVFVADSPVGKAMATAAAMYEQMTKTGTAKNPVTGDERASGTVRAAANIALQQPLAQATRELGTRSPSEFAGEYTGSFVPAIVRDAGEVLDPQARVARADKNAEAWRKFVTPLLGRVPVARTALPVDTSKDAGERGGLGRRALRAIDPFNTTTEGRGPMKRDKRSAGPKVSVPAPQPPRVRF